MSWETSHQPTGSHVPQEHSFIIRSTSQDISFGRKCQTVNIVVVTLQRRHLLASCRPSSSSLGSSSDSIPESDGLVVRAARQRITVRTPRQTANSCHVAHECVHMGACCGIPELYSGVCRRGRNELAIGRDASLRHGLRVAVKHESRTIVGLGRFWRGRGFGLQRREEVGSGTVGGGCWRWGAGW